MAREYPGGQRAVEAKPTPFPGGPPEPHIGHRRYRSAEVSGKGWENWKTFNQNPFSNNHDIYHNINNKLTMLSFPGHSHRSSPNVYAAKMAKLWGQLFGNDRADASGVAAGQSASRHAIIGDGDDEEYAEEEDDEEEDDDDDDDADGDDDGDDGDDDGWWWMVMMMMMTVMMMDDDDDDDDDDDGDDDDDDDGDDDGWWWMMMMTTMMMMVMMMMTTMTMTMTTMLMMVVVVVVVVVLMMLTSRTELTEFFLLRMTPKEIDIQYPKMQCLLPGWASVPRSWSRYSGRWHHKLAQKRCPLQKWGCWLRYLSWQHRRI